MTDRAGLDIGLELDTLSSGAGVLDLSKMPPDGANIRQRQALTGTGTTIVRCCCDYYNQPGPPRSSARNRIIVRHYRQRIAWVNHFELIRRHLLLTGLF